MQLFFDTFGTVLIGLAVITNPIAVAPVWLTLIEGRPEDEIETTRRRVALNMFVLLVVFLFFGSFILDFFSLTLTAIRFAGALVITLTALRMIAAPAPKRLNDDSMDRAMEREDISFSPMTMPLLFGPGTMALMLSYTDQFGYWYSGWGAVQKYLALLIATVLVSVLIYVVLKYSKYLYKLLGNGGITGMARILAFITLAIGMRYFMMATEDFVLKLSQ